MENKTMFMVLGVRAGRKSRFGVQIPERYKIKQPLKVIHFCFSTCILFLFPFTSWRISGLVAYLLKWTSPPCSWAKFKTFFVLLFFFFLLKSLHRISVESKIAFDDKNISGVIKILTIFQNKPELMKLLFFLFSLGFRNCKACFGFQQLKNIML